MRSALYHIYTSLALLLLTGTAGFAQTPRPVAKITGTIINEQNQPVEFATVSLLRAKDSAVVKGALGNLNGAYAFDHVAAGNYIIKTTVVGYTKGLSKPFAVTAATETFSVPAISMRSASKILNTVNIQAAKPLIERKIDRMVVNVENSVLAAGNSAMEILERAPGVTVDKDDNISLQGKAGVTVMINDKLTYLSAAQLATLLRSTDGSNIATIELITNPSAKYDAAGNSGIINIKLKKNQAEGSSGSLTTGLGYGEYGKDNENLSLNYKEGKLNVFSNFSHSDNERQNRIGINRLVGGTVPTYFNQLTYMPTSSHNNSFRVGADYDLTSKHTIGFVASGYSNSDVNNNTTTTFIGSRAGVVDSSLFASSQIDQTNKNFAANLNDRLKLDTLGQALGIDLDYSKFTNNSNASYNNYFYLSNGLQQHPPQFLLNQSPANITIRTAKADYTYPFSKTVKLETGVKFSDVKTDNNLLAQIQNTAGSFVNDTSRTNHFVYQEKIDAGYVNLSKSYKNTSVQVGVRAEYTTSNGDLITKNQVVNRSYLDFFPSLFINHTISPKNEIGFSYSRRIDRPSYADLNPFIYYLDKYTYQQGNPFLTPQYTHSFELHYTWNKTINASLNYSRTTDVITQIILTDTAKKATYQTNLNLQVQNSYGLNINSPYTITKWWTGNANFNGFYLGFKSAGLLGANYNKGQFAYVIKATQNLTFIKGYRFEILSSYKSDLTAGIYDVRPQYNTDAGVSHVFANKKATLKFSVSDVFNTLTNNVNSMYQTVNFSITQKRETRISRLTFTYNFGNTKVKARQHQTGADEEKGRAGGN